jgi:C4-dicarboxylate-specific signal transduction histidine kinase
MIAVSDTGTGMPPAVVERAIEPFFTTKKVYPGSGHGLSMIHGFVNHSVGHMKILFTYGNAANQFSDKNLSTRHYKYSYKNHLE